MRRAALIALRLVLLLLLSVVAGKVVDRYPKATSPILATLVGLVVVLLVVQWAQRRRDRHDPPPSA